MELDDFNNNILACLKKNARTPFAQIGKEVGLTPPAVAQ